MAWINTEFSVLTGGPSAGKSSVIEELAIRGIPHLPEAGSIYIESRLQLGELLPDICAAHNQEALQRNILQTALDLESGVSPTTPHILDRSAADAIGYCKLYGHDREYFIKRLRFRYKHIFHLERLPFKPNHVRIEDDAMAALLDTYLEEGYQELGYDVIRVPIMSVRERADFILNYSK